MEDANERESAEIQPDVPMEELAGNEHADEPVTKYEYVYTCDICGDPGYGHLLAKCSKCDDGAEHTYCMDVMLKKLPTGWKCQDCVAKEEATHVAAAESSEVTTLAAAAESSEVTSLAAAAGSSEVTTLAAAAAGSSEVTTLAAAAGSSDVTTLADAAGSSDVSHLAAAALQSVLEGELVSGLSLQEEVSHKKRKGFEYDLNLSPEENENLLKKARMN
ncbi:hypothetical protein ACFE04_031644 [Oxalis oulophora]